MKLAITGAPGSGKTTLCQRLIEALPSLKIGGILTHELRQQGARVGFEVLDIATGHKGLLAQVDLTVGPKVGKYTVNLTGIERVAIPAIEKALREAQLIVIDEIAPMELKSPAFAHVAEQALSSAKPLVVTFKKSFEHRLIECIRQEFSVYEITSQNRDQLFIRVLAILQRFVASGSATQRGHEASLA